MIARIEAAVAAYPYPTTYRSWPGPNSNTFAWIGRGARAEARAAGDRDRPGLSVRRRQVMCSGNLGSGGLHGRPELGLNGKVAIVTGEGLGRACVERFARSGAKVAACARRKDVLERATDAIRRATGAEILAMAADVTHGEEVEAFVAATVAQFGGVDILVNNAGTSLAAGFEQVDEATWQYDFDLKVMGAIRLRRLVIPHMKRRGGGRIINVTTVGGKAPLARSLPTSVSRAAGINLTKSLVHQGAADKILVNTICLGW